MWLLIPNCARHCMITCTNSMNFRCFQGTAPRECLAKTFAFLGSEKCSECPVGFKCSRPGLAAPENCEPGYYNNVTGQEACTKCEAGRECVNGRESKACRAGYYSADGVANCTICPSGMYSKSSASFCLHCPAGNQCTDPSQPPVNCTDGYVSARGDGDCKLCAAGEY